MRRSKQEVVQRLTEELEKLRLSRQQFNQEADKREKKLIGRICEENGTHLLWVANFDPLSDEVSDVSSDIPQGPTRAIRHIARRITNRNTATPPNEAPNVINVEYHPTVGDRVRIKNKVNKARGDTDQDRLATVTKVNRVRVQVCTATKTPRSRISHRVITSTRPSTRTTTTWVRAYA